MFRVHLDNEDLILGYISGKIGRSFILYGYCQEIESKLKSVVMIQAEGASFSDSATKIRMIRLFFNFNIPFYGNGIRFEIQNFKKLIFFQEVDSKFKLRYEKYENKSFCS
nr:translational initiation factor 1 [Lysimachia stenosepala]